MMWTNCISDEQNISVKSFKGVWGTEVFQGVAGLRF